MSVQEIFDNAHNYTAQQLYQMIRKGHFTLDQLVKGSPTLTDEVRREIKQTIADNDEPDWQEALLDNSVEAIEEYLALHPRGVHAAEGRKMVDDADWEQALDDDDMDGYRFYLQVHPKGEYAAQANAKLDDLAWRNTLQMGTPTAFDTYLATYPNGRHVSEAQEKKANYAQEQAARAEEDAWAMVDKANRADLMDFINAYPRSSHVLEARQLINQIDIEQIFDFDIGELINQIQVIQADRSIDNRPLAVTQLIEENLNKERIRPDEVLDAIVRDPNLLSAGTLKRLISDGYFSYQELVDRGFDTRYVRALTRFQEAPNFPAGARIEKINKLSTEIYFWGIPSSGKSCAIGAVLSAAGSGNVELTGATAMVADNLCQGYGYMNRLPSLLKTNGEVSQLPPGTPVLSTYEMGFDLRNAKGKWHPITLIDMAGELVRIMYKSDAGEEEDLTDDDIEALEVVNNILIDNRTGNRKAHFFVLEYGGENRLYDGLSQKEYLNGVLNYIRSTDIFKKDTVALYLIITKVDKIGLQGRALQDTLRQYIEHGGYRNFYEGLKAICEINEINGGRIEVIPFSMGHVCMQDFCLFDPRPAAHVVRKIIESTKSVDTSKFGKFIKSFTK